jgi:mRNA-degrading endonuclease toxin of MazEF toxin-antitoxin module
MEPIKRFAEWLKLKQKIHEGTHTPLYREGEVWWCNLGENIGTEINGKSTFFTRPIVIFKRLDDRSFVGMSLSTTIKSGSWYAGINFQEKPVSVVISQLRTLSVKRLYSKIGELDEKNRQIVTTAFRELYIN